MNAFPRFYNTGVNWGMPKSNGAAFAQLVTDLGFTMWDMKWRSCSVT
jgi:hypothetical protein